MISTRLVVVLCGLVLALAAGSSPVRGQGNLSVNGLGFPPGQFSARAAGTGGALGELDPVSALNPSATLLFPVATLSMEVSPEFRRITANGQTDNTSTQRFPLFVAAMPFGSRWVVSLTSSTLLDRTWETTTPATQLIGGDTVRYQSTITSTGALNDIRLAVGYEAASWLRLGVGVHTMNGRDVVTHARTFEDTLAFGNTNEPQYTSYAGNALSAGATVVRDKFGSLAASWRRGGHLEQTTIDTISSTVGTTVTLIPRNVAIGTGRIPDRLGLSASFEGVGGLIVVGRTSLDKWSSLGALDSFSGPARDAWDSSFGLESNGTYAGVPLALRLGARWRDLPFPVAPGDFVREQSFGGGVGLAVAQGHALLDVGLLRAVRTANVPVSESAWMLSMGLTIRP